MCKFSENRHSSSILERLRKRRPETMCKYSDMALDGEKLGGGNLSTGAGCLCLYPTTVEEAEGNERQVGTLRMCYPTYEAPVLTMVPMPVSTVKIRKRDYNTAVRHTGGRRPVLAIQKWGYIYDKALKWSMSIGWNLLESVSSIESCTNIGKGRIPSD